MASLNFRFRPKLVDSLKVYNGERFFPPMSAPA